MFLEERNFFSNQSDYWLWKFRVNKNLRRYPAEIYLFIVTNGNSRCCSGVFIVDFELVWNIALVFVVDFEQVNFSWVWSLNWREQIIPQPCTSKLIDMMIHLTLRMYLLLAIQPWSKKTSKLINSVNDSIQEKMSKTQ